jgi:hypothetical protein
MKKNGRNVDFQTQKCSKKWTSEVDADNISSKIRMEAHIPRNVVNATY